jgi:hypothetical protein
MADRQGSPAGTAQPVVRTGVVLASPLATGSTVWVRLDEDGDAVELPYLTSYMPITGDIVQVMFQSGQGGTMSGIVLGGKSGLAGNLVINPNFYRGPALDLLPSVSAPPYHWFIHHAAGTAALVASVPHPSYQKLMMMVQNSGNNTGDLYMYSTAFPVTQGRAYDIRTFAHGVTGPNSAVTVTSYIAWFFTGQAVYPNFHSQDQVGQNIQGSSTTYELYHSATFTAPTGIAWARVAMRAQYNGTTVGSNATTNWSEILVLPD